MKGWCIEMKSLMIILMIIMLTIGSLGFYLLKNPVDKGSEEDTDEDSKITEKFKILHIMSYHSPWKWTDDQLNGFKEVLKGYNIEYNVFQMDTKNNSTDEWKEEAGKQARSLIETWEPDLVYTNDDNVQIYVSKYYVNSSIPFVFSGVNAEPEAYGFVGSTNNAGILERPHFVESVGLLKEIMPDITKIAVISDDGPTWPPLIETMQEQATNQLSDMEFVGWDIVDTFEEYKQKITEYQTTADAICHLGIFTFKDENGSNVPYDTVMQWTVENSELPDFSFWADRIDVGNLAAMTISGYEQGKAAGEIAKGILIDGLSPSSFGFKPTTKGEPVINLARANKLGIQIKSDLLLTANVVKDFSWED